MMMPIYLLNNEISKGYYTSFTSFLVFLPAFPNYSSRSSMVFHRICKHLCILYIWYQLEWLVLLQLEGLENYLPHQIWNWKEICFITQYKKYMVCEMFLPNSLKKDWSKVNILWKATKFEKIFHLVRFDLKIQFFWNGHKILKKSPTCLNATE